MPSQTSFLIENICWRDRLERRPLRQRRSSGRPLSSCSHPSNSASASTSLSTHFWRPKRLRFVGFLKKQVRDLLFTKADAHTADHDFGWPLPIPATVTRRIRGYGRLRVVKRTAGKPSAGTALRSAGMGTGRDFFRSGGHWYFRALRHTAPHAVRGADHRRRSGSSSSELV